MLSQKLQSLSKSLQRDFPDHKGEVARYMHTLITEAKQLEQEPKNATREQRSETPPIAHPERLVYGRSVHHLTPKKQEAIL